VDILDLTLEIKEVDIASNDIYGCAPKSGQHKKTSVCPRMPCRPCYI